MRLELLAFLVAVVAGCAPAASVVPAPTGQTAEVATPAPTAAPATGFIAISPDAPLPEAFRKTADVEAVYRWAGAHRDLLQYMPCTCGCDADGHRSNADCYVKTVNSATDVVWDPHGAG